MGLKLQINEDMKAAMRAKDAPRLSAIRLLMAAIKQRRDSISQYEAAKRQDLADAEKAEIAVLSAYMPQALSAEEVAAEIAAAVATTGANGPADMGKVMSVLKPRLAGRTDMGQASGLVKQALSKG